MIRTIHCLSVREPWASAIADGRKRIEIRSRHTRHRDDILICSTAPHSTALCIVRVITCRRMTPRDEQRSYCPCHPGAWAWHLSTPTRVRPFKVRGALGFFKITADIQTIEEDQKPCNSNSTARPTAAMRSLWRDDAKRLSVIDKERLRDRIGSMKPAAGSPERPNATPSKSQMDAEKSTRKRQNSATPIGRKKEQE